MGSILILMSFFLSFFLVFFFFCPLPPCVLLWSLVLMVVHTPIGDNLREMLKLVRQTPINEQAELYNMVLEVMLGLSKIHIQTSLGFFQVAIQGFDFVPFLPSLNPWYGRLLHEGAKNYPTTWIELFVFVLFCFVFVLFCFCFVLFCFVFLFNQTTQDQLAVLVCAVDTCCDAFVQIQTMSLTHTHTLIHSFICLFYTNQSNKLIQNILLSKIE